MDIEVETRRNSDDIQTLSVTVTRLATLMESSEKRHDDDMDIVKRMVLGLESLSEKMGQLPAISEKLTKNIADTAAHSERLERMSQKIEVGANKFETLGKEVTAAQTKIEGLETWRNKLDGAGTALGRVAYVFWLVFGTAIVSGAYFLIKFCVAHAQLIQPITGE